MAEMPEGLPRAEGWDDVTTESSPPEVVLIQGKTNHSLGRCPICGISYAETVCCFFCGGITTDRTR